ncbi:MAG: hypothetical protein M3176_01010 [Chloroflexota bacterium]|nr:hypothetical protein [Chloroflexota bacterium]
MIRFIAGSGWKPGFAPHQSSRRSQIFYVGDEKTSFHGPVTTGQPFALS